MFDEAMRSQPAWPPTPDRGQTRHAPTADEASIGIPATVRRRRPVPARVTAALCAAIPVLARLRARASRDGCQDDRTTTTPSDPTAWPGLAVVRSRVSHLRADIDRDAVQLRASLASDERT